MGRPKGIPAWNKGLKGHYKPTIETLKKMSIARKGKKRPPFSEEWKKNIGEGHKGLPVSFETRLKISEALKGEKSYMFGKHMPEETKRKMVDTRRKNGSYVAWNKGLPHLKNETNPMWRGDEVGYSGLHTWLTRNFGQPKFCEKCDSKDLSKRYHWANKTGSYMRVRSDWIRLCVKCHKNYDLIKIKEIWYQKGFNDGRKSMTDG